MSATVVTVRAWTLAELLKRLSRPWHEPSFLAPALAVQFVGPGGAETRLLWLAEELERRQPWRRHAPVFDPTAPPAVAPV